MALLFDANPGLSPMEVKQVLQSTANPMAGRQAYEVGSGHVDADEAAQVVEGFDRGLKISPSSRKPRKSSSSRPKPEPSGIAGFHNWVPAFAGMTRTFFYRIGSTNKTLSEYTAS